MKVAITGHRPNKLGNDYDLTSPLLQRIRSEIINIINNYPEPRDIIITNPTFISGMALGIDTLFAEIALVLKYPLICAIPCLGQPSMWPPKSKQRYLNILNSANEIHYITQEPYTHSCMQLRNEWMVDICDVLIAVWDKSSGGTANCVRYAMSIDKLIIYINPKQL